jgi:pantetheine-phosphate adenylyltransferase
MGCPLAVYPGSFDPLTNGHLDILIRANQLFPKIILAVTDNSSKNPLFTIKERCEILKTCTKHLKNVHVEVFSGLLVNYVKKKKAGAIIRGLREMSDFEYEFQMALMNRRLDKKIETVFLMPDEKYTFISSSVVKEVSKLGGSIKGLVPKPVEEMLANKFKER